jgi:uncharacterized OB-fold protein
VHDTFWDYCARDELHIQRCGACGELSWPPVESCDHCESPELTWEKLSGRGTVESWCTFDQQYYAVLPVPYDTILVKLEEGPFFISNPERFSNSEAELGMPVVVAFKECEDDAGTFRLPVFKPV